MLKFNRSQVYLPEREPAPGDFDAIHRIEAVHFKLDRDPSILTGREAIVLSRLRTLLEAGISIREVDIDTEPIEGDKNLVIAGALGDMCAPMRRRLLKDRHEINAWVDTSLTCDY